MRTSSFFSFRRLLMAAGLLVAPAMAGAQPGWQWATNPSESLGSSNAVVTDAAGNAYITGFYSGTGVFGPLSLPPASGPHDVFVAKVRPDGTYQWVVRAGGSGYDQGEALAIGPTGNVVVTGSFEGTATFGTTTLGSTAPHTAGFVAQLSPAGSWQWATALGGPDDCTGQRVAVDATHHVVAGCYTEGADGQQFRVTRLSPTGTPQWTVAPTRMQCFGPLMAPPPQLLGLSTDTAGNIRLAGTYAGDTLTLGSFTMNGGGLFLAQLSAAGAWQWGVGDPVEATDVAQAPDGTTYVTGVFSGTLHLGTTTLVGTSTASNVFVGSFLPNSGWHWATGIGSSADGFTQTPRLSLDHRGILTVAGSFGGLAQCGATILTNGNSDADVFIARLSSAGVWQSAWQSQGVAGAWSFAYPTAVVTDSSGAVYTTGGFRSSALSFGNQHLSKPAAAGPDDSPFLARLQVPLVGLGAETQAAAFGLWPNPAHGTTRLTGLPPGATTAHLLDALGRTVRTAPLAPLTSDLSLHGLPPGLYVVRVGGVSRRLVVE